MKTELKSHDTIVVGWDGSGKVTYCRTFDYTSEKDEAQRILSQVIDEGHRWVISSTEHFLHVDRLKQEKEEIEEEE